MVKAQLGELVSALVSVMLCKAGERVARLPVRSMDGAHTGRQTEKEKEGLEGFPIEKPIEAHLRTL